MNTIIIVTIVLSSLALLIQGWIYETKIKILMNAEFSEGALVRSVGKINLSMIDGYFTKRKSFLVGIETQKEAEKFKLFIKDHVNNLEINLIDEYKTHVFGFSEGRILAIEKEGVSFSTPLVPWRFLEDLITVGGQAYKYAANK